MKRQTLIAIAAAVVLGLVAVFLANSFLTGVQRQNQATEMARVAVATVPIPFGTEITRDNVRFTNYPKSSLPPGSFQSVEQLFPQGERRIALMAISTNEPVLAGKISGAGTNPSIAALLPDGMRAASVRINDVSGVAGFVQPNDSVDVLITRQAGEDRNRQITDVLLQDVRVLAIGQNTGADGKPQLAKNATLQVDPLGAQKLALAQEIGSLGLVLRKPGQDQDNPFVDTVSLEELRYAAARGYRPTNVTYGTQPRAPAQQVARSAPVVRRTAPAARPAPRPTTSNVEVVRGTAGNQYEVGNYGG